MRIKVPLSDLCLLITDGSHYSPKEEMNGVPMFSVKDMGEYSFETTSAKRISEDEYQKLKRNGCEPEIDDVVIAKDGSVLKHVFRVSIKEKCVLLSSIAILRPNPEIVDGEFLAYSLKNPIVQSDVLANYVSGSGVPRIVLKDFKRIPLAVPDLKTQKSIASILRNIDRKIFINSQISNSLEQIAQSFFKSWFIDFDPVKAKMAGKKPVGMDDATAALFPDSMEDSELGPIPKGWKYGTLGDVCLILDSRRVPLSGAERKRRPGSIPYYGATGILDFVDNHLFEGPHILVGEDGSVITKEGTPYVQYVWGKFWVSNHAHVLQGVGGFSVEQLKLFLDRVQISNHVTGAVQPKLNQANLKSIPCLVPQVQISDSFNLIIGPMFEKIRLLSEQTNLLAETRDRLLPRLISGELQIPEEMLVS